MKSFLISLGSQILRDAFAPSDGRGGLITSLLAGPVKAKPQSYIEPDFEYLNLAASRFLRATLMGAVCGLFFVLSALSTVFVATQTYDTQGQFFITSTFVASLLIFLLSGAGVIVARRYAMKVSFSWNSFLRGSTQFSVPEAMADALATKAAAAQAQFDQEEHAEVLQPEVVGEKEEKASPRSERWAS